MKKLHENLQEAQDKTQNEEVKQSIQELGEESQQAMNDFQDHFIEVGDKMDALNGAPEMARPSFAVCYWSRELNWMSGTTVNTPH